MKTITFDEEKYQLVPKVATREMMQAAWDKGNDLWNTPEGEDRLPLHQYEAMLAAAPAHPDTGAGDAEDVARLDRMESALEQIQEWASAYPIGLFPEPDWAASAKVLKAAGLSLDAISAANMLHVITRAQEIVEHSMRASKGGE